MIKSFNPVGFKMTLLKRDLFRKIIINKKVKYEAIIIGDSTYQFWNFGEPILKNYDMVFNYEDNTVGFKVNNNFLGGNWTSVIILSYYIKLDKFYKSCICNPSLSSFPFNFAISSSLKFFLKIVFLFLII